MNTSIEALLAAGPPDDAAFPDGDAAARIARRADDEGLLDVAYGYVDAPFGRVLVAATPAGLVRVGFGTETGVLEDLAHRLSPRMLEAPGRVDAYRRELDEYFAGRRVDFDVPLDWALSKGFRRTVLEALHREVGYGHLVSYRDLAWRVGNPNASRAVGTAMATNPLPIVVPCHRVLRTGGNLGGYGGGLDVKRWLLSLEGSLPTLT
jgi:methylated-DNA-[protein]-cysteine S-methyltransferase